MKFIEEVIVSSSPTSGRDGAGTKMTKRAGGAAIQVKKPRPA
jgi:hypothetical protein